MSSGQDEARAGTGTESWLLAAARAGDQNAVGALYERHRSGALAFARSLSHNNHDAEDLLHDAFERTTKALQNGNGPTENFLAYMYTAIRTTAVRRWKRNLREQPVGFEGIGRESTQDERLEAVLDIQDHERVLAALKTLPKRWQTVLWYADVLQVKPRHIAPMLGISANAVSALHLRAKKGLRKAYLDLLAGNDNTTDTSAL